ncbi:hypothetical protein D9M68_989210 [compost metagenome]
MGSNSQTASATASVRREAHACHSTNDAPIRNNAAALMTTPLRTCASQGVGVIASAATPSTLTATDARPRRGRRNWQKCSEKITKQVVLASRKDRLANWKVAVSG